MSARCRARMVGLLLALSVVTSPARAGLKDMLLVVTNPNSLTAQETLRRNSFLAAGYTITLIDDAATQASFDTALAGKSVAYVPVSIAAASLGTKLHCRGSARAASLGRYCVRLQLA